MYRTPNCSHVSVIAVVAWDMIMITPFDTLFVDLLLFVIVLIWLVISLINHFVGQNNINPG